MTTVSINPGTGPVSRSNWVRARANVIAYCEETNCHRHKYLRTETLKDHAEGESRGRYLFAVWHKVNGRNCRHEIEMPGLPLDSVRFLDAEKQDAFLFPRLYVDGSSWLWKFAITQLEDCGKDDE